LEPTGKWQQLLLALWDPIDHALLRLRAIKKWNTGAANFHYPAIAPAI
jgi:hypothetical protein